jgi:hypothetical protein
VANAPDADLYYTTSGGSDLYIYVEGTGDTTLLINTADGTWMCDDDGYEGTNPLVVIRNAPSGLYDIWVGSYDSEYHPATLFVSELDPRNDEASTRFPDLTRDPTFGSVTLSAGFLPDPYRAELLGGGSVDLDMGECTYGFVAVAPDFNLFYETTGKGPLYLYAEGAEDITLLINTPEGDWFCNDDDLTGTNPLIVLSGASAGLYNIWVGSYESELTDAELYISEIDPRSGL